MKNNNTLPIKNELVVMTKKTYLNRKNREKWLLNLIFIGPALVLFTVFFTYPLINGIRYAFTDWDGISTKLNYVGFDNFIRLFTKDPDFIYSLGITFKIAFLSVVFLNILAMLFAIALTSNFKLNNFIRASIFLPNIISMVISGFIWNFMFSKISDKLSVTTGMSFLNQNWLGDDKLVIFSILIVAIWQGVGYIMTIYIAAILGVDTSLLEAASIDGANPWQSFFKIRLPLMLPIVTVGAFLTVSGSMKIFDVVFSLTGGGPGHASDVVMLNIYNEAYTNQSPGYASAKAVIIAIIIVAITVTQLKLSSKKEVQ